MSEASTSKEQLRKASSDAIRAKMDLHDLTEELPLGWETIPALAERTFQAYKLLADLKAKQTATLE